MKRTTLTILALLAAVHPQASAQEPMNLDELENRRGVYLQRPSFEPYSGPVVAYWDHGELRERGTLVEGRWHGVYEEYYALGTLKARETYRNGVLHGPFEAYFKKGAPSDKGSYSNGRLDGPYESFWSRGHVAEQGHWASGEPCGEWLSFGRTLVFPACPGSGR